MKPESARWRVATDVAIALVFTVFCLVVTAHIPPEEGERYNGWGVVTIIVVGAALLFRRRHPYVTLGIVIAGLATYTVANFAGGPVYLAPLVPLYTIAQRGDRRRTWTAVVATIALLLPFALVGDRWEQNFVYFLAFAGWIGGAVFLGTAHFSRRAYLAELEQRARYLEESRDEEARRRVAEERLRIARDLHDVIAHGIATIHMQSGAALHVLDRHPEQAAPALTAIKQLSKQTLDELRMTVGVLRDDEDVPLAPTPGLEQLERLGRQRARRRHHRQPRLRRPARVGAGGGRRRGVSHRAGSTDERDAPRGRERDGDRHRPPRRRRDHGRGRRRRTRRGVGRRRRRMAAGTASRACPSERSPSADPSSPVLDRAVVSGSSPGCHWRAPRSGRHHDILRDDTFWNIHRDPGRARRRPGAAPGRACACCSTPRTTSRSSARPTTARRRSSSPGSCCPTCRDGHPDAERRWAGGDPHDRRRSLPRRRSMSWC